MGCLVLEKGAMLKQEVNVVASSELAILLRPLQLAVIVCIESKHSPILVVGQCGICLV